MRTGLTRSELHDLHFQESVADEGEAEPLAPQGFTMKDTEDTKRWHIGLRSLDSGFASQRLCVQRVP